MPNKTIRFQSTHPHGVRLLLATPLLHFSCFNPRTHTGCDTPVFLIDVSPLRFQSTHPHGVRQNSQSCHPRVFPCFNPRTHTGCDPTFCVSLHPKRFQSTHPHGVRPGREQWSLRHPGFNPRTHTGCDISRWPCVLLSYGFNPRTHTGCDSIPGKNLIIMLQSYKFCDTLQKIASLK